MEKSRVTNVLLLISDEHNPRYSSTYGHEVIRTPNMDRLAERGVVYDSAYCPSPLCVPSRTAFMAGRYTHETQAYNNSKVIERRHPSFGGVLDAQGIHSLYVGGGSNLYRDPFHLGFSEMLAVERTGKGLGTHSIEAERPSSKPVKTEEAHGAVEEMYAPDEINIDAAIDWIRDSAPTVGRPWAMTICINPPHPPYTTEPEHWDRSHGWGDLPEHGTEQESAQHPYAQDVRDNSRWDYSDDLVRDLRQGYYGAVSFVDDQLGRLIDAVDAGGLTEDTVILYTTDHGEMLGKFGLWGKCSLYEDAVRVPIIAAGPGFPKGIRSSTPVTTLDLQASIFEAVGARRPEAWRGQPLQSIAVDDPHRPAFASYHGHNVRGGGFMLRLGDWKLLYNSAAPHQLFNLRDDPDELVNLWSDRPDMVAVLETELRAICDPEAVERDAAAVRAQQFEAERSLRQQYGLERGLVPWEEMKGQLAQ